jgi:hypothetical protein
MLVWYADGPNHGEMEELSCTEAAQTWEEIQRARKSMSSRLAAFQADPARVARLQAEQQRYDHAVRVQIHPALGQPISMFVGPVTNR